MNSTLHRALLCLFTAGVAACGKDVTQPGPPTELSQAARNYLEQLLAVMQASSVNRLKIDWTAFRAAVLAETPRAQYIADTYPAIRRALTLLGDGHSLFRTPTGATISVPNRTCSAPAAAAPGLPATIGYVRVSSFSGSFAQASTFAASIQGTIRSADRDDITGWIVDVRGNGGGNMWPMIAGIGPILGEGVAGQFIDPQGARSVWEYRAGASRIDGVIAHPVTAPYQLLRQQPRVAVLTDNRVASSGEAVVVAFRNRPDTRSFGAGTCGLSTANREFTMPDGAALYLTVSVMADRTGHPYGDVILPDEVIADPNQAVTRAVQWLEAGN